jgi:hypothetical protein
VPSDCLEPSIAAQTAWERRRRPRQLRACVPSLCTVASVRDVHDAPQKPVFALSSRCRLTTYRGLGSGAAPDACVKPTTAEPARGMIVTMPASRTDRTSESYRDEGSRHRNGDPPR